MEARDPVLEIQDLEVSFSSSHGEVRAVRGVTLDVMPGEMLGIVGESGSGKTTLLMSILGLLPPSGRVRAGSIRYGGRDLVGLSESEMVSIRGRHMALIPQKAMNALSPVTSIGRQLRRFAESTSASSPTSEYLVDMLRRVGLAIPAQRLRGYPYEFSGGQLQRMLIAASTIPGRPNLLLADEPTSTLDATVQAQVLSLLRDLQTSLGLSVVFVTHDLGVVAQLCDRVAVMYAGEIVEVADIDSIFHDPKHPYTQALLGTLPSRHRRGEALASIPGSVADSMAIEGACRFAPRCAHAFETCLTSWPADRLADHSVVKCHLYPAVAVTR